MPCSHIQPTAEGLTYSGFPSGISGCCLSGSTLKCSEFKQELAMADSSIMIWQYLSEGLTIDEIVARYPQLGYRQVIQAASRVFRLSESQTAPVSGIWRWGQAKKCIHNMKARYPHAYTAWTAEEQEWLCREFQSGRSIWQLSDQLGRHPGSVKKQLEKLGVLPENQGRFCEQVELREKVISP